MIVAPLKSFQGALVAVSATAKYYMPCPHAHPDILYTGTFGNRVPPRQREPGWSAFYFFLVFVFIHKCPTLSWLESFRSRNGKFHTSKTSFYKWIYPIALALSGIIDEVDPSLRLDPMNHGLPPFDTCFTGMVDTLPVYPSGCHDWWVSTLFFQPKHGACVLKMQLGITFTGNLDRFVIPKLSCVPR